MIYVCKLFKIIRYFFFVERNEKKNYFVLVGWLIKEIIVFKLVSKKL